MKDCIGKGETSVNKKERRGRGRGGGKRNIEKDDME